MARPKKAESERLKERATLWFPADEYVRHCENAAAASLSLSEYFRALIRKGKVEVKVSRRLDRESFNQLRGLAVNLNQIATVANAKGEISPALARACEQVEDFLMRQIEDGS
jgi:hypothetical protein